EPQADFRDLILANWDELPARGAGRISFTRDVVARLSFAYRERRHCRATAGYGAYGGLHAVHAQSDHWIFLLRAAARSDRARHYRRGGDEPRHVCRRGGTARE